LPHTHLNGIYNINFIFYFADKVLVDGSALVWWIMAKNNPVLEPSSQRIYLNFRKNRIFFACMLCWGTNVCSPHGEI